MPTGVKRSTVCINITIRSVTMDLATVIGERAKRARHSQVCSIENRGYIIYIIYIIIMVRAIFVLITRIEGGALF